MCRGDVITAPRVNITFDLERRESLQQAANTDWIWFESESTN